MNAQRLASAALKIAFRVDASKRLGAGHLTRCLALASQLHLRGAKILFLCRGAPGTLLDPIRSNGYDLCELPDIERETEQEESDGSLARPPYLLDVQHCADALRAAGGADWLVIDHYGIGEPWEREARALGCRLLVIDDLADRRHDCDIPVNPNVVDPDIERRYVGTLGTHCTCLVGPKYALLGPTFIGARASARARDGSIRRVLISFGGGDRTLDTLRALEALRPVVDAQTHIDVVVAAASRNPEIAARCAEFGRATLHIQTSHMAEIISNADLALGAGGVSALERCCLGLPSIVLSVAENQVPGSRQLGRRGAALYLGRADDVDFRSVQSAFLTLNASPELMCHMSNAASELLDANGASRVARKMLEPKISLRRASEADSAAIYEWRNAIETRRGAFDPAPIAYSTHVQWFNATLANPRRALLIGECAGVAVGVLRFDLADARATVSIYLVPELQGRGHGPALLEYGEKWLREHHPDVREIHALVRSDNRASLAAFAAVGYEPHGQVLRRSLEHEL